MSLFFPETPKGIVELYYPVDDKDFANIVSHQYKQFPIRFFNKKFLCPTLNPDYARRIASERSNWSSSTSFVHILRFLVYTKALEAYIKTDIEEQSRVRIVVPKEKLQQFNQSIVGYIERISLHNLNDPGNQLV